MSVLKLKELREKANMTQRDVAELLNVSQQGYWFWENGKRFPSGEKILELCEIFKCTPNDLFGVHGEYNVSMSKLDI